MLHRRRSARAGVAATSGPATASARAAQVRRRLAHKADAAIIDVGACRSGGEEIAQGLKESGRVVVGEKRCRIKARRAGPREGRRIDERTGGIGRGAASAIGAVRIAREFCAGGKPVMEGLWLCPYERTGAVQ